MSNTENVNKTRINSYEKFVNFAAAMIVNPKKLAIWLVTLIMVFCDLLFKIDRPWRDYLNGLTYSMVIYSFWTIFNYQIFKWLDDFLELFTRKVINATKEVSTAIVQLGADVSGGVSFTKLATNFGNHKAGIGLCTKDIICADSAVAIAGEIGKIGSMLGLETNVSHLIIGGLTNLVIPDVVELRSIDDMLPAAGALLTLMGKEVADVDISSFLTKNANNTKNVKILVDNFSTAFQAMGLTKGNNYDILLELNTRVLALKDELAWIQSCVSIRGTELITPEGKIRVDKFKVELKAIQTILHTTSNTTLKNNAIFTTCQQISVKSNELIVTVEMLQSQKQRVKPVGVCIHGLTGVGKTMLSSTLIDKIKKYILEKKILKLGEVQNWRTWYAQFRDEFDSGYAGHEVVYMDDAFQQKSCEDHLMWYSFISDAPIGMVMAKETEKGKPFNGKLVVTSCNVLPTKSITVNDITALQTRFPVTINARLKEGIRPPKNFDPTFAHLDFRVAPMNQMLNDADVAKMPKVSLDWIVEHVATRMLDNHNLWEQVMQITEPPAILQSGDEDDEIIYFNPEEDWGGDEEDENLRNIWSPEEITGRAPVISTIEEEEEEEVEQVPEVVVVERPLGPIGVGPRTIDNSLPWVAMVTGAEDKLRWRDNSKAIMNGFLRCLDAQPIQTVAEMGEWVGYLTRFRDGRNAIDVCREDGATPVEFLLTLGAYRMPPAEEIEFWDMYAHAGFFVVEHLGVNYIWSPFLFAGSKLILCTPEVRQIVIRKLLPRWKELVLDTPDALTEFWNDPIWRRTLGRFIVGSITMSVSVNPFVMLTGTYMTVNIIYTAATRYSWRFNWVAQYTTQFAMWDNAIMNKLFERLSGSLNWLRNTINQSILSVLGLLGVDINEFMEDTLSIIGDTVVQGVILVIVSVLIYAIYRLLKVLLTKAKSDEDVVSLYSPSTHVRPDKRTRLMNRNIKWHSEDLDDKECTIHEVDQDKQKWEYVHQDKNEDTFYTGALIDIIEDLSEDTDGNFIGIVKKNLSSCYLVQVEDGGDSLQFSKSEIKRFKLVDCGGVKVLRIKLQLYGTISKIKETYISMTKRYLKLAVRDYSCQFIVSQKGDTVLLSMDMHCLNRTQGGSVCSITKKLVSSHSEEAEDWNQTKMKLKLSTEDVILKSEQAALDIYRTVKHNHYVVISKLADNSFDSDRPGFKTYGVGSENHIYFNEHLATRGEIVRFWKVSGWDGSYSDYNLALVVKSNTEEDRSVARILGREEAMLLLTGNKHLFRMSSDILQFPSLVDKLYSRETFEVVAKDCKVIVHLPKTGVDATGNATFTGAIPLNLEAGVRKMAYLQIDRISSGVTISQKGDCGGLIHNLTDRFENKLMGLYAAGGASKWYATILTQEDLITDKVELRSDGDTWENLISKGEPKDMPNGPGATFVGRFIRNSPPVSKTSLSHWHYSPWADEFEELLEPSPLDARDERITAPIMMNQEGQASLLMEQNSKMVEELKDIDIDLLNIIEEQFVNEYSTKMYRNLKTVSSNLEEVIHIALNGDRNNRFVKTISTNKSAGLPWTATAKKKKSEYIDIHPISGELKFNNEPHGLALHKRVEFKLSEAKAGRRVYSFSNSKIKDSLIKKSAVAIGKIRVFHAISVDKIIADAAVFGHFKETYMKQFIDFNHAVGANPHSVDWTIIADHLRKHNNFFDVDFANYDKYLHGDLMRCVFNIIRRVTQLCAPDDWDAARGVLADEAINTFVIDYDTVYKTDRGNKSGEFLTTVLNCIANDILSFYAWCITTKNRDITEFRDNVRNISFGDDKIESVSDLYRDRYNYMTVKVALEAIGHKITPGSKDGIEQPFTNFSDLQFLKRTFKELDGWIVGPIMPRSLEAPFTWTQIKDDEVTIWTELIKQSCEEAMLQSPEYFDEFCGKLRKCSNPFLQNKVAHLVSRTYAEAKRDYIARYLNYQQNE